MPLAKGLDLLGMLTAVALLPLCQVAEVSEGELFRVETVDWTGGQVGDNDSADDIKYVDLTQVRAATKFDARGCL